MRAPKDKCHRARRSTHPSCRLQKPRCCPFFRTARNNSRLDRVGFVGLRHRYCAEPNQQLSVAAVCRSGGNILRERQGSIAQAVTSWRERRCFTRNAMTLFKRERRLNCCFCGKETVFRKPFMRHGKHLLATLVTAGLWSIPWLILTLRWVFVRSWRCNVCRHRYRREAVTVQPSENAWPAGLRSAHRVPKTF